MTAEQGIATARAALAAGVARKASRYPAHVRHAFCNTCNARERAIVAGRCHICGNDPARKTNNNNNTETTGDLS